jgi:hypothetical protein
MEMSVPSVNDLMSQNKKIQDAVEPCLFKNSTSEGSRFKIGEKEVDQQERALQGCCTFMSASFQTTPDDLRSRTTKSHLHK